MISGFGLCPSCEIACAALYEQFTINTAMGRTHQLATAEETKRGGQLARTERHTYCKVNTRMDRIVN